MPSVPEIVESVVVACHVGTPFTSASTWPFVPAEVVAIAPLPLPRRIAFAWNAFCPVPPLGTVSAVPSVSPPFTVRPLLNVRAVVVAFPGKRYAKFA
jgi:hypothetical protein